jgi:iron(III) transport system permease protein
MSAVIHQVESTGAGHGNAAARLWTATTLAIGTLIAVPLVSVVAIALGPADGIWEHLLATVLPVYVSNTLWLMLGVGIGTITIGTSTAWLVTMYRFPGRRVLSWALLLPLAVPSYILAFVITDQLEYAGAVQGSLRAVFGWTSARDYWFPEIRSLGGAIVVMSLVLYPYVYLLARAAFLEQCFALFEVSRSLGRGPFASFVTVAIPMARPAIAVGVSLALMETLNDFGTIDFFAVATLTGGIFDVWLNMNSTAGAAQLAVVLVTFALVLVALERVSRRSRRYHSTSTRVQALPDYRLARGWGIASTVWCLLPVALGFGLPAVVLCNYAAEFYAVTLEADYFRYVWNSVRLATWAAAVAAGLGILLAYGARLAPRRTIRGLAEFATVGYAVPGAVLAVGILVPLGHVDNALDELSRSLFDAPLGLLISGTATGLVVGYVVRFLALSYRTVDASLARITPSMDGAARTLGCGAGAALRRVHLPLVRPSVITAALLVFVDTMKELPLTLILLPFDFDTLATFVYQYASDELLEESALGALTIVAAGVIPVLLMSQTIAHSRPGHR